MKKFFILIIIILGTLIVNAQTRLTGKVYDAESKEPLIGVNVYLPELKSGGITGSNGRYSIQLPHNKSIKVVFSHIGYKTILKNVEPESLNCIIDVELKPISLESEEVVVSGINPSTQHENAIKIERLKASEVEAFGSPNLIEALSSIPGVSMISKSPGVSLPIIRGMSMTNIIVMNNGVKLENYQYSKNHAFIIDEFGIEHIEVIKGPVSLLYGSGAVGGVINFIKEKPALTDGIVGDYTGHYHSNTKGICNSLGIKGKNEDLFWGVRVGYKSHADYLDGNGDYVPNTRFNDISFKTSLGLIKPYGSFKLYYDYNRPKLGMCMAQVFPLIQKRGRKLKWWYPDLTSHVVSSRNKLFLGDFKFDVNFSYQSNHRKGLTDTTKIAYKLVDGTMSTVSYELKTHLPSGKNTEYILGIQGENRKNRNHDAPVIIIPDADINDFSVFGLIQFNLWDRLKAQGGVRYDHRDLSTKTRDSSSEIIKNYDNISTSIGATFTANEQLLFRFNVASAYRTPNMGELTQDGWHGNHYEKGDPGLKAQKNFETDLSLHYHSNNLMIDLTGFYNHVDNYIFMSPTSDTTSNGAKIYKHSQSNAKLYGGELTCAYAPANWIQLQATGSIIHAEKIDGSNLPLIPPGQLSLTAKLKRKQVLFLQNPYVKFGIELEGEQNKPSFFETKTNAYCLFNIGAAAQIEFWKQPVDIGIFVNNLLNKTYYNHLSTIKDLGFYNMGRNISFLVKVPF